jgi:1-acyl-sn-glycerol-3-phosphate acyltransferase
VRSFVAWLARTVTRIFYRVECAGHVPPGPVLLLPNHPNSLLDPAIVWATAGRDVRFLAKSTLFHGALGPLMRAAGAIPVYRRVDDADLARNAEMFAAVEQALADGDAVCVFPEGLTHSSGRLEPLRTGAARMALGAEKRGVGVSLVAVGLNFDRKTSFRSRATVVYGRPFSARDVVQADDRTAVQALRSRMADEMRRLLVEADPDADATVVRRVGRLYAAARGRPQSPADRIERDRAIANGLEKLRQVDPERYRQLSARVQQYDRELDRFGLRDRHLDWDVSARAAWAFLLREGLRAIVLVPLVVAGLALFWIPYRLTGLLAQRMVSSADVRATVTVGIGAAVHAVWLALVVYLAWRWLGPVAAVWSLAGVPALAIAGLFAIEREAAVVHAARSWLMLRRARHPARATLKQVRSEIADLLDAAHEWLTATSGTP